jgi:hypothetical protein
MANVRLALIAVLLAGCIIDELQHENRFCSMDNPCAEGFTCQQGKCVAKSASPDGPTMTDVLADTVVDKGPTPDGPQTPDLPIADDLPPVPDAGCPAGLTLCAGACIDTDISFDHCGGCDQPCEPGVSDRCENGNCHCGHLQPLCLDGLTCYKGACSCVTGPSSMCKGCCQNDKCQTGTSTSACGLGGVACVTCATYPCRNTSCDSTSGKCTYSNRPNGISCVASGKQGKCFNGNCCTGCWSPTKAACYSGTSNTYCGNFGNNCATCTAPNTCKNQVCAP